MDCKQTNIYRIPGSEWGEEEKDNEVGDRVLVGSCDACCFLGGQERPLQVETRRERGKQIAMGLPNSRSSVIQGCGGGQVTGNAFYKAGKSQSTPALNDCNGKTGAHTKCVLVLPGEQCDDVSKRSSVPRAEGR